MVRIPENSRAILDKAKEHQSFWKARQDKFDDWYRLLILDDSAIYQEDMETVISNDPKTFYKKAIKILAKEVNHSIPTDLIARPELVNTSSIVKFIELQWENKELQYRRRGRQSWLREFVSFLLATGWYDVLRYASQQDGLVAEVRNPANCFPMYSDGYLESHFHIYTLSYESAALKCHRQGWAVPRQVKGKGQVILYDYWFYHEGQVYNTVVIGSDVVKPPVLMQFNEIPILAGPVGGMPDRGSLLQGDLEWAGRIGESIVADNEAVYANLNKQLSFTQQIIRDIAQPKMKEYSTGDTAILNPETMFRRGAIFRMGLQEDVKPMETPPLPVELSLHTRSLDSMIQRGSFPYTMYGGIDQAITSYTMSQISAAAKEILGDYADATKYIMEDIDNTWIASMQQLGLEIDGWQIPDGFPLMAKFKVSVAISIPGDFVQRATLSRMLSPDFKLSKGTVMNLLWSEIKDPDMELAKARADMALDHPVAITINLISSWRYHASTLREAGETGSAQLFDGVADMLESQLLSGGQPQGAAPPTQITPRQEVMPRERTAESEVMT